MTGSSRERRGFVASISVLVALVLASSTSVSIALAKGHRSGMHVQSREWLLSIGHRVTKVPANATVIYCAGEAVESMTPRLVLSTSGPGLHYYAYHIVNPSGRPSLNVFAGINNGRSVIERAFIPIQWNKAEARETNPLFRPGKYTVAMVLDAKIVGIHVKGGKYKPIETLTLKPKSGKNC
jgi:hypothetical protein